MPFGKRKHFGGPNSMQTKFAVLVAVAALVMGGNIRADVVGLQTNTNQISSVPGGFDISGGDTLLYFEFGTTGLSGAKFTGISFNNLGANNIDFIAELRECTRSRANQLV